MYRNGCGNRNTSIAKVGDFYVQQGKVSNKVYRDMIVWANKTGNKESADLMIPDYSYLDENNKDGITCNRLTDYFLDPKYDDYPVVGITYQQILEFIRLKSKKDGVKYRLMTNEEYEFLIYDVKNVRINGDTKIIQNESFDDVIKNKIAEENERIKLDNIIIKQKAKKNKKKLCGRKAMSSEFKERELVNYNFKEYYNLRYKGLEINSKKPFYTNIYSHSPNDLLIYDLVGNVYEITCQEKDLSEYSDAEDYVFTLRGGSCFDFYEDIVEEVPAFYEGYDDVRYDRGFRLVKDA